MAICLKVIMVILTIKIFQLFYIKTILFKDQPLIGCNELI